MPPNLEPTYRLEPKLTFAVNPALSMIASLVNSSLGSLTDYSAAACSQFAKHLADEMKHRLGCLPFTRYRLIALVTIGELEDQRIQVASKCMWDRHSDTYISYSGSNKRLYCVAMVYAVYKQ